MKFKQLFFFIIILSGGFINAQTVKGTVSDANGPLPSASVYVKGTTNGTSSDFDGNFILNNISENAVLVVSYIGYKTKEVPVNGESVIDVILELDASTLDEIIVIGYGTQKKSDLTTSISTISSKDIKEIPASDIGQTLQGRAAGVSVTNGGSPGGKTAVRIRGLSTFGDGDPLYVVDGVFTSSLNNIDPASIKKVDVLKDAAASAIYGSRGSNGVVIVTTNRGRVGKTSFNVSTYSGIQSSNKRYDVLNTEQYIQYIKEVSALSVQDGGIQGGVPRFINDPNFDGDGVETDWQEELFRITGISSVNFSASGGTEKAIFSFGASTFDQKGIYVDTEFKRHTFNVNSELNVTDKFRVGETLSLGFTSRIAPQLSGGREPLLNVLGAIPYSPVTDENGNFLAFEAQDNSQSRNQLRVQNTDDNLNRNTTIIGSLYGEYDILEGLKFRTQFGLDAFYMSQDNIQRAFNSGQFPDPNTTITKGRTNQISTIFTNSLSYSKTFAEKHNFDVTLVSERQDTKVEALQAVSVNSVSSEIPELVASGQTSSTTNEEILISYLGRVNYNYDGKYLVSASIRRDKSSKFAPGAQTGFFPATSIGWVPSKESFLDNHKYITNMKLRASFGQTGNNKIPNYAYLATLSPNFTYPIGQNPVTPGYALAGGSNPDLTWEKSTKQNYGIDLGFLNNKYTIEFDYYNNRSDDLLVQQPEIPSIGNSNGFLAKNVGSVVVDGFELTLGINDYEGDFTWNVWANITTSRSEVKSIGSTDQILQAQINQINNTEISRIAVGQPLYHFYGYIFEGVYADEQAIIDHIGDDNLISNRRSRSAYKVQGGDARYRDINGDGDITDEDRVVIGNPNPDFIYSFNFKANYKNFDMSALITGVQGVDAFNANVFTLESQQIFANRGTSVLRRWQQPGDITDIPRFRGGVNDNNAISTRYIEDASFARLKNVTLGYTFPKKFLNGMFSKVRVYVQSQNLLTITNYSGLDPEIEPFYNASGLIEGINIDRGRAPQPRTFLTGLQIEF